MPCISAGRILVPCVSAGRRLVPCVSAGRGLVPCVVSGGTVDWVAVGVRSACFRLAAGQADMDIQESASTGYTGYARGGGRGW